MTINFNKPNDNMLHQNFSFDYAAINIDLAAELATRAANLNLISNSKKLIVFWTQTQTRKKTRLFAKLVLELENELALK